MNATSMPAPSVNGRNAIIGLVWRYFIVALLTATATIAVAVWRDRLGIEARVSSNAQQVTELDRRLTSLEAKHEELMKEISEYSRRNSERYGEITTRLALIEQLARQKAAR